MYVCLFMYAATTTGGTDFFAFFFDPGLGCKMLCRNPDPFVLELDFEPFNADFPRMTRPKSIGNGVQFLNRHLSSRLFRDPESMEPLFEFLQLHSYGGEVGYSRSGMIQFPSPV